MRKPLLIFINFSQKNNDKITFLLVIIIGLYLFIQKIPTIFCERDNKVSESLTKMIFDIITEYYK